LLLANGLAAASLILLAFIPLAPGSRWLLFALLLPTTMAIALGDVIVDALMVEKGQPLGLTGRFQSIQWTAANAALLLTGVLGGYVAQERLQSLAFALCGVLWLFALAVAWRYAGDREDTQLDAASLHDTGAALLGLAGPLRRHQLGRPRDLLLDRVTLRTVGLDVLCGDEVHRFLPLPTASVSDDEIAILSPLVLLEEDELHFYRSKTFALSTLRGRSVQRKSRDLGALGDVVINAAGELVAVVVAGQRIVSDGELRFAANRRSACRRPARISAAR
jgi:MFS family permease